METFNNRGIEMPPQSGKNSLLGKLGAALQKAHEEHKGDEIEYSKFGELPPTIKSGIAQLVECKFDQYKTGDLAGEYFFYAAGTVLDPTEADDGSGTGRMMKIDGLRTSIMEPMCDTPKKTNRPTISDHVAWVYNEMRKLGIDTNDLDPSNLESTVEALKQVQPTFRFSTRGWTPPAIPGQPAPTPMLLQDWNGLVDFTPNTDEQVQVKEPTKPVQSVRTPAAVAPKTAVPAKVATPAAKAPVTPTPAPAAAKKPPTPPVKPPVKVAPPPAPEPEPIDPAMVDQSDLDSLSTRADGGDEQAQADLTKFANDAGVTDEQMSAVSDWAAVVVLIKGQSAEAPAVGDEWKPEVEQVYFYKPITGVGKNRKPAAKGIEVEIKAVDEANRKADIVALDDPKKKWTIVWEDLKSSAYE